MGGQHWRRCTSCLKLCGGVGGATALTLALAVVLFAYSDESITVSVHVRDGPPLPAPPAASHRVFHRDGYVLVRGLLSGQFLKAAQDAAQAETNRKHYVFDRLFHTYSKISFAAYQRQDGLADVVFSSAVPSAAAAVIGGQTPLRVVRDAVMAFAPGRSGCGWHVDDKGFWPTLDNHTDGANVWIALSPMPAAQGGGLAVCPGSHAEQWAATCRQYIKDSQNGTGPATCLMEERSPECHARFERCKVVHDMQQGDAIILHRGTFHRSEPFRVESGGALLRYNVRYVPETTQLFATGFEAAVIRNVEGVHNGSRLSEAGSYYPQAWPYSLEEERQALEKGFSSEPSLALICRKLLLKFGVI
eukprot:6176279-Pleurochrysis_carterae.AAC.1